MSPRNLPISRKLVGAFAVLIVVFASAGWAVFGNLQSLSNASIEKERSMSAMQVAEQLMIQVLEQQNAARAFAILAESKFLDTYQEAGATFTKTLGAFKEASGSADQLERADKLAEAVATVRGKLDHVIKLAHNPATRAEAGALSGVKMLGEVRPLIKEIHEAQQAKVDAAIAQERGAQDSARFAIWLGGFVSLALAALLGWLLSREIAAPVRKITELMKALADGNNRVEVPNTTRGDEIGSMAQAVLVFREAAIAKEQADAAKAAADAEQKLVVEALERGLGKLAEGDLTAEIRETFSPSYATVKSNFNEALTSLRTLIGSVSESATTIRTGSGEIAQASENLARRTEANAASLEETSAAISQMDQRLRAGAVAAGQTVERADGAIATVSGGRAIADEAVQAMTRVADSAKGIDSVIEGLDKIAFQTRVLAMNAAVEAGRAGEAGRGFAVVADLVSALAMRAEEEAGRARDQLTATQTDIVAAVEMVQKVDGALADIAGGVGEVHSLLGQMAADNQAQSTAITEISVAIGTMDQSTQQNAAMVEQTSAAARNLSGEVSSLADQAARFTVGSAAVRPAVRKPTPRPTVATNSYVSPVKPLPATAMGKAPAASDDWMSF